jgi:hypothetical protein
MFDQKFNFETIAKQLSESTFGLYHGVDLEVFDITYNMVGYWLEQQQNGMIGPRELDIKMNTMSNIAESVNIFIRVHKPGRFEDWSKKNGK